MKNTFLILAISFIGSSVFAKQSLQDALLLNSKVDAVYQAIKASAGVDCDTVFTSQSTKVSGPLSRVATTHQVACFDPYAENPNQLGQLVITFYGTGENEKSPVGELVDIQFTVWK